ncbi:MAG: hypothetical protein GJT30_18595 [Geobacter sp.]|nr:hypothetical protein [Geobacter sp.]
MKKEGIMRNFMAIAFLFVAVNAYADGYMLKAGRFPEGKVTVLTLTTEQQQLIDLDRRCRKNKYTPYIFRLTPEQSERLRKEAGSSPKRFAIFESYQGDRGIDIEFNVINRFNEKTIEIPHKLLIPERQLRDWERNTMGWEPNPLDKPGIAKLVTGKCP